MNNLNQEKVDKSRRIRNWLLPALYEFAPWGDIETRCECKLSDHDAPWLVELVLFYDKPDFRGGSVLLSDADLDGEDAADVAMRRLITQRKYVELWSATRKL